MTSPAGGSVRRGGAAARAWLVDHLAALGATVETVDFPVRAVPDVYAAPTVVWGDGRRLDTPGLRPAGRDPLGLRRHGRASGAARWAWPVAAIRRTGGWWCPTGMSLFDAYGDAQGAAGLLMRRAVDADGWQYTILAGPDPGPLPILTLDADTHRAVLAAAAAGAGWLSGNTPLRRARRHRHQHPRHLPPGAAGWGRPAADRPLRRGGRPSRPAASPARRTTPAVSRWSSKPPGSCPPHCLRGWDCRSRCSTPRRSAPWAPPTTPAQLRAGDTHPLVINVDGAGRLDQAAAVEAGGPAHALLALLDQAGRHTGVPLAAGPVASDNRRYGAAGLAAVGIGAGMGGYHSPADTPDRVDPDTLAAIARLVVATGWPRRAR